jgi:hypothetical protein
VVANQFLKIGEGKGIVQRGGSGAGK